MKRYSFSKLEVFDQCPYRFKLKYLDENYSEESTLVMEIGGLSHSVKEVWGNALQDNKQPDINYLNYILQNGIEFQEVVVINGIEAKNQITEKWLGIKDLKNKYFETYNEQCNKSGMTYNEKIDIFWKNILNTELQDWQVKGVEENFAFIYDNRCMLHGFIDRVDQNHNGDIRVVDYKTSKDIYDDSKLKTPLQMFIYGLACENMYKKIPIEYVYDFIFLGQLQYACSKGYWDRGKKKLNGLLDKIDECANKNEYIPKPSPLCHWCEFSNNTCAKDKKLNGKCDYYSLWTPNSKNFNVNKKWNDFNNAIEEQKTVVKKEFIW